MTHPAARVIITTSGLLLIWEAGVRLSGVEPFILPGPIDVFASLVERPALLAKNAAVTLTEIVLGLLIGTFLGTLTAITSALYRPAKQWLMPVLVISQALPVFALAPVLVLWLGYGMASKVAMAVLIIYFPVTAALYDGLRRTDPGWLDLARTMGSNRMTVLRHIRLPAALPAFASGVRVAAAVAPIGAIVGEWVGSSAGLGYLMLHANARMQIDFMFAGLFVLAILAVSLYFLVDFGMRRLTRWHHETDPFND